MDAADDSYDVIVVGAGFGGPVAAKKCAEAGLRTLMLERGARAGEKVISGLTIPFYGFLFGPAFIRDGNPPIERPADGIINFIVKDLDTGDIDIDDSLRVPKPLAPVIAFGYNAYCQPFCEWEANKAVEAGVELRTSTVAVDVIKEDGRVAGIITDGGARLACKVLIDAEGCQGLLAIKAGVREKYPPDVISLADVYDYEMPRADVDRVFGYTLWFCWGWDEQRIAPPLGYGNGLMVWPYRESVHFIQDQCLEADGGKVPSLKDFDEYHRNITSGLPRWSREVAPHIKLRSRVWDGFEIFVGLNDELRKLPNHADGMILIGDAAGLESTELCDGVPAAWFSADIAADVAIEAIRKGDTSADALGKYDQKIKEHPIIQWSITRTNRHDLRLAQRDHNEKLLKKLVHQGWGLGGFAHVSTPLLRMAFDSISDDPTIITSWIRMFFRYYYNWAHDRFDGEEEPRDAGTTGARTGGERVFKRTLESMDRALARFSSGVSRAAALLAPTSTAANPTLKVLLPVVEPLYHGMMRLLEPVCDPLSRKLVDFTRGADPALFDDPDRKEG
jgi:electron transfer flavoprotein-quinone oxidoreductase